MTEIEKIEQYAKNAKKNATLDGIDAASAHKAALQSALFDCTVAICRTIETVAGRISDAIDRNA